MSLFSGKKGQEVRGRRDAIDSIRVILREGGVSGIPLPSIVVSEQCSSMCGRVRGARR